MVNLALSEGPQRVSTHKDTIVVLAEKDYEALLGTRPDFREFLLTGPSFEDLDLTRDSTPMHQVDL